MIGTGLSFCGTINYMTKLRVAMIAPPWLRVPPEGYGGIESMLATLIQGLQELDVAVELFAVGGSEPGCPVHACYDGEQYKFMHQAFRNSSPVATGQMSFALNEIVQDGHYDIIHDHSTFVGLLALRWATEYPAMPPALHTAHGAFFTTPDTVAKDLPDYTPAWQAFAQASKVFVVGISQFQMSQGPKALLSRTLPVVYNGVDPAEFTFQPAKQDYFLTLARMMPFKGIHIAAKLCGDMGYPLKIAGPVAEMADPRLVIKEVNAASSPYEATASFKYFKNSIWPLVKEHREIEYLGSISGELKKQTLANAKALLFPLTWDEPFGLVVIEALASGTPVVAMRRGAMAELVQHGKTGFLADTETEFRAFMKRVDEIDPAACRQSVQERFSNRSMAAAYVARYQEVIRRSKKS